MVLLERNRTNFVKKEVWNQKSKLNFENFVLGVILKGRPHFGEGQDQHFLNEQNHTNALIGGLQGKVGSKTRFFLNVIYE